ncbi:hypothetical protein PIB30_023708 [Stylosanthes scabra]|uniref:Uncharacterized protein n=1 Tax=Stylosanthes scabra TaxID=79078 RepID=A0ABU6UBG5_9FABA|nr:hypothetical protein [Stylosanthes scabra]
MRYPGGSTVYSVYGSAVSVLNKRSSYVGEGSEVGAHKGGSHGVLGGGATSMNKAEGRDVFLDVEDIELMLHRGSLLVGAPVLEPIIRKANDSFVTYEFRLFLPRNERGSEQVVYGPQSIDERVTC